MRQAIVLTSSLVEATHASSAIGRTSAPITYDVERGHVRRFAQAIGDANPIYRDDKAERIPAPPTFAIALRANDPREGLDIDFTKLLHGEQEFEYHRPVVVGDVLSGEGKIVDLYEKETDSATMTFIVIETVWRDDATGEPVVTERFNLIGRTKK